MRLILISFIFLTPWLFAMEPSVYGAGNMDSAEPYGLTATEKSVLQNRKTIQNLKNRVAEQQNRIDGLTTIINGLNKDILNLKEQSGNGAGGSENSYNMLLELAQMVEQINNNYVTQVDLEEALATGKVTRKTAPQKSSVTSSLGSASDDFTIYRRAVQLFGQRSYQSAKESFEKTLANGYKSASSNYYLGEIAYYTKDYTNAVGYYKKSASLNNSASYMKILYLHTAISLARDGQVDQAKNFFQFVIDNYPDTKAAEIARKNL